MKLVLRAVDEFEQRGAVWARDIGNCEFQAGELEFLNIFSAPLSKPFERLDRPFIR